MSCFIPLSVPNLKGNELKYVQEVINQEWVSTGGKMITRFEDDVSKYIGVDAAAACQSGTAGIHLALLLSEINSEHEVIVPTLTFIAAVNPVRYVNADPIFMDCDDTLCLDPDKLNEFCAKECYFKSGKLINKKTNKHIKAVIVVHVFGNMADMERIMPITKKYNLTLIEDATEALGTFYTKGDLKGRFAGTIGDYGVFSFNGNKIITTGGGGMLVARDIEKVKTAKYLSTQAKADELFFIHDEIGFNYRMTNLQAAVGVAQLEQLEAFIGVKENNYNLYQNKLSGNGEVTLFRFRNDIRPNYWFYSVVLKSRQTRDYIIRYLQGNNIQSRPVWGLIHKQVPYKGFYSYKISRAKSFGDRIINIPCSTNLSEKDVCIVADCINKAIISE